MISKIKKKSLRHSAKNCSRMLARKNIYQKQDLHSSCIRAYWQQCILGNIAQSRRVIFHIYFGALASAVESLVNV